METLLQVLMRRDNMSEKDAKELIKDCKKQVLEGETPRKFCMISGWNLTTFLKFFKELS